MLKQDIKILKKRSLALYVIIPIISIILYPKLIAINDKLLYFIIWLNWSGIGALFFIHRFLTIVEHTRKKGKIDHFFSAEGRELIHSDPQLYLSAENYNKYRFNFIYLLIFFGFTGSALVIFSLLTL